MIRELINRVIFEVVGEDRLRRWNDGLQESADNSEEAARETAEYEQAIASLRNRLRTAGNTVRNFGRQLTAPIRGFRAASLGASAFGNRVRSLARDLTIFPRAIGRAGLSIGRFVRRLAIGPLAFVGFIGAAVRLASQGEETRDRMRVALGDIADATEVWATRTSNALNLNRNLVRSFVTDFSLQLQRATDLASATDIARDLTERAFDLESFRDVPVDEVFAAFRSGINGSTEPLDRFNVNLRATAVDAFILANGMAASSSAITENTRRLARARIILLETQNAQGNLILTSGSFANVFRSFLNVLRNITEDIGQGFLPAAVRLFQTLRDELRENQDRIIGFFNNIASRVDRFIANGGLDRIAGLFRDIASFAGQAAGAVDRVFNISERERAIDEVQQEIIAELNPIVRNLLVPGSPRSQRIRAEAEEIVDGRREPVVARTSLATSFAGSSPLNNQNFNQVVNVNIAQTNSTPQQIENAVRSGVSGTRQTLRQISSFNGLSSQGPTQ